MNFLFINDLDIARGCLLCSVEPSMALHVLSLEHFCIMTWDISCNDKGKLLLNFSHTLLSGRSKALKKVIELNLMLCMTHRVGLLECQLCVS